MLFSLPHRVNVFVGQPAGELCLLRFPNIPYLLDLP